MNCYYLVSHGSYSLINKTSFKVPDNIRLIQYTTPNTVLTNWAVSHILEKPCNSLIPNNMFIVTQDRDLLREKIHKKIINPGEKTVDIELTFGKPVSGISLGMYKKNNNNKAVLLFEEKIKGYIMLSKYLEEFSKSVKMYIGEGVIVDVHQLSCRFERPASRLYEIIKKGSESDIDEISRSIENIDLDDSNIPLYSTDELYFDKKTILYTEDKEYAIEFWKKLLEKWRKQNIKNSRTEKRNKTYEKKKEDRILKNYKSLFKSSKMHIYEDKKTTRNTRKTTRRTRNTRKTTRRTRKKTKTPTNPFLRYLPSVTG
jgi:hypothetical protein